MDVTYNFTAGTRAVAEQVNQNFADVKSAVDPLQTAVSDIHTQLESGIILPDGSVDFTRLQSYATYTVSNATNATPIVITAVAHSFLTGDKVYIIGVGGNTAANGVFTITKIGADTFSLDGSVGNGAFSSNGTAVIYPSADKNLPNKAYVDNGDLKSIVQIGTCSTAAATAEKVVTLSGFVLATGTTIQVTFTNANTATTPTLNVNSTGAKAIYNEAGTAVSSTNPAYFPTGSTVEFIYNGTNWVFKKRVIENYVNEKSWYRIYSDGWIEQGNLYYPASSVKGYNTITFPKSFKNTNFTFNHNIMFNTISGSGNGCEVYTSRTSSSVVLGISEDWFGFQWRASGY